MSYTFYQFGVLTICILGIVFFVIKAITPIGDDDTNEVLENNSVRRKSKWKTSDEVEVLNSISYPNSVNRGTIQYLWMEVYQNEPAKVIDVIVKMSDHSLCSYKTYELRNLTYEKLDQS